MQQGAAGWALAALLSSLVVETGAHAQEWVEFEMIEQSALPIVRAKLNGMGGQRFVLDVGFSEVVIDDLIVDATGMELLTQGEVVTIDYYGDKEKVPVAYLEKLEVGEVDFQMVRALLVNGDDGTGIGGIRSYGRIGRDVLEPLRLTVHYPRRLLFFEASPSDEVPPGGVTYEPAGRFLMIPVTLGREEGPIEVRFILDPGTSNTVIDRKWAEKNGFSPGKATRAILPSIEIGGFHRQEMPVLTGIMHQLPYDGDPIGVIGADLLTKLSVTYDFARDLVWLVQLEEKAESP